MRFLPGAPLESTQRSNHYARIFRRHQGRRLRGRQLVDL